MTNPNPCRVRFVSLENRGEARGENRGAELACALEISIERERGVELRRAHHDALDALAVLRSVSGSIRDGYRFDDARAPAVLTRFEAAVAVLAGELAHLTPAYQRLLNELEASS